MQRFLVFAFAFWLFLNIIEWKSKKKNIKIHDIYTRIDTFELRNVRFDELISKNLSKKKT